MTHASMERIRTIDWERERRKLTPPLRPAILPFEREGRLQSAERAVPTFIEHSRLRTFFQPDSCGLQACIERSFVCIPTRKTHLPFPRRPSLEQYKKRAKELVHACNAADPAALRDWAKDWIGTLARLADAAPARLIDADTAIDQFEQFTRRQAASSKKFPLAQAQFVIARAHGFESWPKLAKHISAMAGRKSAISAFESAAEAIVAGELPKLENLLLQNPELVRLRSTREHGRRCCTMCRRTESKITASGRRKISWRSRSFSFTRAPT